MKEEECNYKIKDFINNNNFSKLARDITNKQQYNIRNIINKCKNIISTKNIWKYINMNPSSMHTRNYKITQVRKIYTSSS
jgi:hypothetical protein